MAGGLRGHAFLERVVHLDRDLFDVGVAVAGISVEVGGLDDAGEVVQQVELPYLQRSRTPQEEKRLLEQRWGGTSPAEIGIDLVFSETEAVVRRIHPWPDGSLWIQTCNSAHNVGAGVFRVYDVVDADGLALTTQVKIPHEPLLPGPRGSRIEVVDYDVSADSFYAPFAIGDEDIFAKEKNLDVLVADPRFHAQNVYGVVASTLFEFERALGVISHGGLSTEAIN